MRRRIKNLNAGKFTESFSRSINRDHQDVCFYLYGSVLRDDFIEVSSDIDGGLIFDCDVVLPKKEIRDISKILNELQKKYGVNTQFNLLDMVLNKEGRFMSYTDDYTDYLKSEAEVFSDRDFLGEMNGVNYCHSALHSAAFNLRRQRNGLLSVGKNSDEFFGALKKNFLDSQESFLGLPKKLLFLQTEKWIFNKEACLEFLKDFLQDYNQDFLEYSLRLRREPQLLDSLDGNGMRDLYEQSVTETEKMIREYLKNFPEISWREARSDNVIKQLELKK